LTSASSTFITENVSETERFRVSLDLTFGHRHVIDVVLGSHFHHIFPHIVSQTPKFIHFQHNIIVQLIDLIVHHRYERNTSEHSQTAKSDGASRHDFTRFHHDFSLSE